VFVVVVLWAGMRCRLERERRRNVFKTHLYITRPAKTRQNKIYMMAIPSVLRVLAVNVALLVVSSVLVAEVKMDEETMVFVLTGLCVLIF